LYIILIHQKKWKGKLIGAKKFRAIVGKGGTYNNLTKRINDCTEESLIIKLRRGISFKVVFRKEKKDCFVNGLPIQRDSQGNILNVSDSLT